MTMKAAHDIITGEIKRCHGLPLTAREWFYSDDFYDIRDISLAVPGVVDGLFRRITIDDDHCVAMLYNDYVVTWSWREPHNPWKFGIYPAVSGVYLGEMSHEASRLSISPLDWLQNGGVCYVS